MVNIGHYSLGFSEYRHRGKLVRSIVGNQTAIDTIKNINPNDFEVGYIPNGYEDRPDLISWVYYGTVDDYWSIMFYSNLPDAFEDFKVGKQLLAFKDE